MRKYKVSEILKLLKDDGWILSYQQGSHRQFIHNTVMDKINVNISWSGDNYCAGIEYLGIIVVTNKVLTKLYQDIDSSFKFHIEGCIANGDLVSENISAGNYEFEYNFEVSALLHKLDGIVTKAAIARATGINERQIGHYASGLHTPRAEQRNRIVEGIRNIGKELSSVR